MRGEVSRVYCAHVFSKLVRNHDHVEGYAFVRGLCALSENAYAEGYAHVMRIISLATPLDPDASWSG